MNHDQFTAGRYILPRLSRPRGRQGFSLIELLVAMGIGMIIGGAIISVLVSQLQLTATQNRNIINQEDLRETLNFITGEIACTGSGLAEPFIDTATSSELKFRGDMDDDGAPDQVDFVYSNGQLSRLLYSTEDGGATWTLVSTDVLLHHVASFSFTYFGASNSDPAGAVGAITAVEVKCALNTTGEETAFTSGRLAPQAMVARVTIRNRML